jgi:hemerythrin-like metal-binding domain
MPALQWCEAMTVGVPALDADHRCLVRIINLLSEASTTDVPQLIETVLETLLVYSRFHFSREERVMAGCRFPGFEFHAVEHAGFTRNIQALRQRVGQDLDAKVATELYDYLTGWLRHHILIQDMAYKPFVVDTPELNAMAERVAPPIELASLQPEIVS